MPKNFPGVHGCPADDLPSFLCTDGLPVDLWPLVRSKALDRALHHATLIPTVEGEVLEEQWKQIDLCKQAVKNILTTIERVEEWSRQNLTADQESQHEHETHATHYRRHETKSHR